MYNLDQVDTIDYNKQRTEIVYYHDRNKNQTVNEALSNTKHAARKHSASKSNSSSKSNESESSSEGMTNDGSACWMTSVLQALRGCPRFREEYAPKKDDKNILKKELFKLFDISEGKNGQKRRAVKSKEVRDFKRIVIKEGHPVKLDGGYFENPLLLFLLKKFKAQPIEYLSKGKSKPKKELVLSMSLSTTSKHRPIQKEINQQKIAFATKSKAPKFLPIYLDRPVEKHYYSKKDYASESSRTPVEPTSNIEIPLADKTGKAVYKLASVVIGRDSQGHAYSYVVEKTNGKTVWVQYNDSRVTVHEKPETKLKTKSSNQTPFEDACKHAGILMYELSGFTK
jgi:uncharacterized UBP type Zn finger protein